jgi:hypothetical protein
MSSHKSGSATASENEAKRPCKSITLEEKWKLLEERRVHQIVRSCLSLLYY